jgi:calcineurin-like phosphoesterase family protein
MDKVMIENWNNRITSEDVVYHLGDFGTPGVIWHLKGSQINIVRGNHDHAGIVESLIKDPRVNIIPSNSFFSMNNKKLFGMVHRPLKAKSGSHFYCFGHIHKLQMVKRNGLNVGVDCHNFAPIRLETILGYFEAISGRDFTEDVFIDRLGDYSPIELGASTALRPTDCNPNP